VRGGHRGAGDGVLKVSYQYICHFRIQK
jgi:hypothetical protein